MNPRRPATWPAYAAAGLAFAYAAVSLYWAVGGTAALSTVGGYAERMARAGGPAADVAIGATVLLKCMGGLLALGLVRRWGDRLPRRLTLGLAGAAAGVLVLYGVIVVGAAALVETHVVVVRSAVDWRDLRWHMDLWDAWFLAWGLLLAAAVWEARRRSPAG